MRNEIRTLFVDVSQTFFLGNAKSGALLCVVVAFFAPHPVLAGLFTGGCARLYSHYLRINRSALDTGLFGMNGFFLGAGMVSLFQFQFPFPEIPLLALGGVLCATLTICLHRVLLNRQFPVLVLPYALTLSGLWPLRGLPWLTVRTVNLTPNIDLPFAKTFWFAVTNSFSAIFFQNNPWLGAALILYLLYTQRTLFTWGVVGAVGANAVALCMGLSPELVRSGYWGFSGVLVAMALGWGYKGVRPVEIVFAILLSVLLLGALGTTLVKIELLPLSIPYIATVWLTLAAIPLHAKNNSISQPNDFKNLPWNKTALDPQIPATFFSLKSPQTGK